MPCEEGLVLREEVPDEGTPSIFFVPASPGLGGFSNWAARMVLFLTKTT